ncbi:cytochrome c family protein [Tistrella mobilis]|uniref:c-type cytochrome n=1 Tax=Tistrella mobilis TaxID=171437 RepID=UPI0035592E8F
MKRIGQVVLGLVSVLAATAPARADPERGQTLFAACAACHETGPVSGRRAPSLKGIIGRPAGSLTDFRYSKAMSQSGIVWTDETIRKFIQSPQAFIPGNRMPFSGIPSEADRADIVDYLKTISTESRS